jgi:hypothetical protein
MNYFQVQRLVAILTVHKVGAGYTNDAGEKNAVSSPYLAPAGVILDAELTLATPERLWSVIPRIHVGLHHSSCTGYLLESEHLTMLSNLCTGRMLSPR